MDHAVSTPDFEPDARKRVCKACDRCRIKKSKCDGKKPCSRCKNDDAICVFGGRKKKTDRVHPKGYVEILERQQRQLVKGIRAMYDRQLSGQRWDGPCPDHGYPPTHEILEVLGALDPEDSSDEDAEEDRCQFEDSVRRLRKSVDGSMSSVRPQYLEHSSSISKKDEVLPDRRSKHYSAKTHPGSFKTETDASRRSPDSLTMSTTSPSTSIDSQHWSTSFWIEQRQVVRSEKGDFAVAECEQDTLDSPMLDVFGDPFLAASWGVEDDLCHLPVH